VCPAVILHPLVLTPALAAFLAWAQLAAVVAYTGAQILLVLYASHRYLLLWRWWRGRGGRVAASPGHPCDRPLPLVTVQLPIYNESRVVTRLIDAAANLQYPPGRLEIQVLDDSDDETRDRAALAVARHRERGVDLHHLCRPRRTGFKAGALADGLARARGELVAVFDADFVPAPDFLLRIAPRFADPAVGMVQARWGHLNRARSALTAAQATLLDAHFLVEHPARMHAGLFFNFNGTAGVWRRACIEDAGGWSDDTVTEDLDLSYRAQLAGWRFVFADAVEAPGELPGDLAALRSQQRRWARGAIQTARKLLPRIWRSPLSRRVKIEALIHLTGNLAYPLLLALGLLLLPVLLGPASLPAAVVWAIQAGVLALGVLPVCLFLIAGRWAAGGGPARIARDVVGAMILGIGLSVNNTRAALEGLGGAVGDWERTPKTGDISGRPRPSGHYPAARRLAGRTELLLAAWFTGVGVLAWSAGHAGAVPFAALLVAGFGSVGLGTIRASRVGAPAGPAGKYGSRPRRDRPGPGPATAGRSWETAGP
jgi:cellulose synthase/poly-beta-1,6-N-acetylglucosamine synthase-like glycosyltransferase